MGVSPPQFGEDPALPLTAELAPSRVPHTFRALRHRNFRLFIGGQIVSLIGTWMQNVAQSWLVYRLTHSELLLGTAWFCAQIAVFALGPLGRNRRRSLFPPEGGHRHADPVDVAGLRAGGAHAHRARAGLACARSRRTARRDQRLRHAGTAGAGDPDDLQGRSDQRHLAEFRGIQRGARGGAGASPDCCWRWSAKAPVS